MKNFIYAASALFAMMTAGNAAAGMEDVQYVCTFDATGMRVGTLQEKETKAYGTFTTKNVYKVQISRAEDDIFNQDGQEHLVAVIQKGYIGIDGKFKVTAVKTHEVTKVTHAGHTANVTQLKGEFFDMSIASNDDRPAKLFFDGFDNEISANGKCTEF